MNIFKSRIMYNNKELPCIKRKVYINNKVNTVDIGIPEYNEDKDILLININNKRQTLNVDYTVSSDRTKINKVNGYWNEGLHGITMDIIVINYIYIPTTGGGSCDGSVADGIISINKLDANLKDKVNKIDTIDSKTTQLADSKANKNDIGNLQGQINNITVGSGNTNSEVVQSRINKLGIGFASLKGNIDALFDGLSNGGINLVEYYNWSNKTINNGVDSDNPTWLSSEIFYLGENNIVKISLLDNVFCYIHRYKYTNNTFVYYDKLTTIGANSLYNLTSDKLYYYRIQFAKNDVSAITSQELNKISISIKFDLKYIDSIKVYLENLINSNKSSVDSNLTIINKKLLDKIGYNELINGWCANYNTDINKWSIGGYHQGVANTWDNMLKYDDFISNDTEVIEISKGYEMIINKHTLDGIYISSTNFLEGVYSDLNFNNFKYKIYFRNKVSPTEKRKKDDYYLIKFLKGDIKKILGINNELKKQTENMTWVTYGDSLFQDGNDLNIDSWQYIVQRYFNFKKFVGVGIGGTSFSMQQGHTYNFANDFVEGNSLPQMCYIGMNPTDTKNVDFCSWYRINKSIPSNADVIVIGTSANDLGIKDGGVDFIQGDKTDLDWYNSTYYSKYNGDYDITSIKGGIMSTIMKIQCKAPNALIFISNFPNSRGTTGQDSTSTKDLTNTINLLNSIDYTTNILGIKLIDIFHESGINPLNRSIYTKDAIHLNKYGNKKIANPIIGYMKMLLNNM